jgi:hypothetical protein
MRRRARQVDDAPDLERLAEVPLNLNRRLGAMVLEDGRVYFGTTEYAGKVALRPAIVNWRTTEKDVDLIVEAVREQGARLLATAPGR